MNNDVTHMLLIRFIYLFHLHLAATGISKGFDVASGLFKGHFGALTWPQYFEEILGPKRTTTTTTTTTKKQGILIYARDYFVICSSADTPEIITVSVCYGPSKVLISLFYGAPNSSSQIFEDLFFIFAFTIAQCW